MMHREPDRKLLPRKAYQALALVGGGIAAGAAAYAAFIEPRSLLVRSINLATPTLPIELDGLVIAFLSDFHLGGPGDPLGSVNRALAALETSRPDIVLLGGDYYDHGMRVRDEPDWSRFPAIAPTYAVPGNHDYNTDSLATKKVLSALTDAGIRVLRNEAADVQIGDGALRIIGLDDPYSGRAHLERALKGLPDEYFPRIILAHAGLIADSLPVGSADLILSGHTHGAQIRFSPFNHTGPLDIYWWLDHIHKKPVSPYRQGMFRVRGSMLYTGNGLGTTSLGMRFLAPPELTLFTLITDSGRPEMPCDDPERYVLDQQTRRIW